MRKHHPANERIKRRYLHWLRDAKQLSEETVDQAAAAIAAFEASTNYREFKKFHVEQATRFKRVLGAHKNPKTGRPLAKATIHARLMAVKAFFQWLSDQPGYKSRIAYVDTEYFNPSANDGRIAKAEREQPVPTVEQIKHVLSTMRGETDIERRDRALIAFTLLSGARDNAIASLSVKHVDPDRRMVFQDAREVRTKRAKTIQSWFFPVGDDVEAIVADWIIFLRTELLFSDDEPLFPATEIGLDANRQFSTTGVSRKRWKDAGPIRRIFKEAFESAELPYFNPHSFRSTLAQLGQRLCRTPEEFKVWSQNLGHEKVLTTFTSYGKVGAVRQASVMSELKRTAVQGATVDDDLIEKAIAAMRRGARLDEGRNA